MLGQFLFICRKETLDPASSVAFIDTVEETD